jgi:shikimate kinase
LTVWLRVSPDVAVVRTGAAADRPLLAGADPLGAAVELLAARSPAYAEATVEVDTDGRTPLDVSRTVLALLERHRSTLAAGT